MGNQESNTLNIGCIDLPAGSAVIFTPAELNLSTKLG